MQAGVFTRDLYKAHRAWDVLEVGGVIIGDVPSWRVDHMPYGGVKDSGLGREGVKFAMEDFSEKISSCLDSLTADRSGEAKLYLTKHAFLKNSSEF